MVQGGNVFDGIVPDDAGESFSTLYKQVGLQIERIVSHGHSSPPGDWFDQDQGEWVIVLSGSASLLFEDEPAARSLHAGDWLYIAPHRRHRVESTDSFVPTIWIAAHFQQPELA